MHESEWGHLKAGGYESASQYLLQRIEQKPLKNDLHKVYIDACGAL